MQTNNAIIKVQIVELDKVTSLLERSLHSASASASFEAYAKLVEAKIKLISMLDN